MRHVYTPVFIALVMGCAFTRNRPCSKAGDTSWYPPISGNMQCYQSQAPNGDLMNQGLFRQFNQNGKIALEGEFQSVKKNGLWVQYDEKGNRIAEKWYEFGIERSIPDSARKVDPRNPHP